MQIANVQIEAVQGDIAHQPDVDAVVNAANAQLQTGGGVAGAIHRKAGPELAEACIPLAPIQPGEAVITDAFKLPNKKIIHVLGPVFGRDKPEDGLLDNCYRNALQLAEQERLESVAFPAISTGAFGYPLREATEVALSSLQSIAPSLRFVKHIRIVLFSESDLQEYQHQMQQ